MILLLSIMRKSLLWYFLGVWFAVLLIEMSNRYLRSSIFICNVKSCGLQIYSWSTFLSNDCKAVPLGQWEN